jgi:hypothetical protein
VGKSSAVSAAPLDSETREVAALAATHKIHFAVVIAASSL